MDLRFKNIPVPNTGTLQAVTPTIQWLRMPLPFDLDHINLYLIDDGELGYALIDTGISTSKVEAAWDLILKSLDKPISKVIVTHLHPDHVGMAGYLVEKCHAPLYMSHAEYFVARALSAGSRGASDRPENDYLKRCGMSESYIKEAQKNRASSPGLSKLIKPIPVQFERLQANDVLTIGDSEWQVIIGRGHSPEHVCLYDAKNEILISGDHILPIISPNIGVYSTEPNANTLQMYLDTLPQFFKLPETTLVLPSHKQPFYGLHIRVQELVQHHHKHLEALLEHCKIGKTIEQCLPVLFNRKLNQHNLFFAIAEAFSHLNYLYFAKQCTRIINDRGQFVFTSVQELNSK